MTSQYWFRQWIGAVRQQAITWANVDPDPCRHMASLGRNELTHCGTGMPHGIRDLLSSLFQIMACSLFSTKPLPEPVVTYCQLDPQEHISMKYNLKFKHFHSWKYVCSGLSVLTHWGQEKWQTLCRQHFQMDFVKRNVLYSDSDGICSWHYVNIGSCLYFPQLCCNIVSLDHNDLKDSLHLKFESQQKHFFVFKEMGFRFHLPWVNMFA